jgi:hypothetical protein
VSGRDAVNGRVDIELITKVEYPILIFESAYADGTVNGCVLINRTTETISTRGLVMRDSGGREWHMPDIRVAPGEQLNLAGRNSTDASELLKVQMGFRVRSGTILYIYNAEGEILDEFKVR